MLVVLFHLYNIFFHLSVMVFKVFENDILFCYYIIHRKQEVIKY